MKQGTRQESAVPISNGKNNTPLILISSEFSQVAIRHRCIKFEWLNCTKDREIPVNPGVQ